MAVKYDKLFAVFKERNMKDVWKRVSEETLYRNAGRVGGKQRHRRP